MDVEEVGMGCGDWMGLAQDRDHTCGCCVAIADSSHTYGTGIYQMRCTAYEVAPDDGLIQSETCRASNGK